LLKERKYVIIKDKNFFPTDVGVKVTDKLQEFFSSFINVNYTAGMEKDLDLIADGNLVWYNVVDEFYKDFEPLLKVAFKEMEKDAPEETGEVCPNCGKPLVIRNGKFGKFTACSNYPECKYIKKEEKKIIEICDCPKCGHKIIEKKSKRGKVFYGCNNYPKCDYATWDKPSL
jgi:DNA topoisomerase-1